MHTAFLTDIEQAKILYNRYLCEGKTYALASSLKEVNLSLRSALDQLLPHLPILLRSSAQQLIDHFTNWLSLWNAHNQTASFQPTDEFVFPTQIPFPQRACRSLVEYLYTQTTEILFIGKKNDPCAYQAAEYLQQIYPKAKVVFGERGTPFPEDLLWWQGDYIFSYLSPWIIPGPLLQRAALGAINWHPGPPTYPGIGCTNFAIYNQEKEFGITCHYMADKVDTGTIVEVRPVAVLESDTVLSLTQKCYAQILNSFFSVIESITAGKPLPVSPLHWARAPYTRRELNALCMIDPTMSSQEVFRRIKATTYDKPWAYTEVAGQKFFVL